MCKHKGLHPLNGSVGRLSEFKMSALLGIGAVILIVISYISYFDKYRYLVLRV